jgi:hypothetical protein
MALMAYKQLNDIKDLQARAGNCKSLDFPCTLTPKSISALKNAPSYSGHDLILNGGYYLLDVVISKPFRILLLVNYGKYIDVVSSCSLMHKPEIASGVAIEDVYPNFAYGISFVMNLRLIKRIVSDLWGTMGADSELASFVIMLSTILINEGIAIPDGAPSRRIKEQATSMLYIPGLVITAEDGYNTFSLKCDLILAEQFLRYSNDIMITNKDEVVKRAYGAYRLGQTCIHIKGVISDDQLRTIRKQRANHKLKEWHRICKAIDEHLEPV